MLPAKKHTYSAVLVNYNHSRFLPAAIGGVLGQSVPFDEIVVIDDGSTDDSVAVIEELIRGVPQARLVRRERNRGVVATLNGALKETKSEFIFYLAADDTYAPDIVAWCERLLARHPGVGMISGNARVVDEDTGKEYVFILPFPQEVGAYTTEDLKRVTGTRAVTFFGGSNVFRRDVLEAVGGQREELKWHADWFLYLQIACRYPFGVVPAEMARIRQTKDQYSHASREWNRQRPVIESFVRLLRRDYPAEYRFFRACALLPTYDLQALPLLLGDGELREYLTPLLVWRLLSYKALRCIGRLIPDRLRNGIRRLARV